MRLVDADALKKAIENVQYTQEFCIEHQIDYSISMQMLGMIIDNAPTVELFCSYLSDGEVRQPCVEAPCKAERPQGE